ncbi:MAG: T9SS type A sorting domain-containing protein [Flavobacteriales bacterium]|nr:T9SS type A sorting domain-containing protein [Flavobacteriales bacterium]
MKKIYFIFSLILATFASQAQQNVSLKINHQLDTSAFVFNQVASNNLGNSFTITRLQYYISEIKLTHDGGLVTNVPSTYILVDAATTTNVALGSFNITSLEGISFGIGVEAPMNNADPSLHAATHPLAPKSPSMHWGWTSGYRFVAIEGNTGTNFSQIWQIHALGNRNYRTQNIVTSGKLQNGTIVAELDADYTQGLTGITVNSNLLNHGEFNESATLLTNFRTGVFTPLTVGLSENKQLVKFGIFPNPSTKDVFVTIDANYQNLSYAVFDLTGREVTNGLLNPSQGNQLSIEQKGIYLLNLYDDGLFIGSEKLIIQ